MSGSPATKPVLVNLYEHKTDRLLTAAADEHGERLLTKVRVADVIDIDRLGVTGRARSYALAAHFDFVMVDEATRPRFAVEFDGSLHRTDARTIERDAIKDHLCQAADLPLLRITSRFTMSDTRWPILTYLVDAFYKSEVFDEAQEAGLIDADEPFDAGTFLIRNPDGRLTFNTLDAEALLSLLQHWQAGRISSYGTESWITAVPDATGYQAHAWMAVAHDRYLISHVTIHPYRFAGVGPTELADQLATVEIAEMVDAWLTSPDQAVACDGRALGKAMREVQAAIDAGGFLGCHGYSGALVAGGTVTETVRVPR